MTVNENVGAQDWVTKLAVDRERLDRGSAAERVTEILRQRITEGFFQPGARLSEAALCSALGVSRNTLREAFRLLGKDRLVAHELHRGVFVRVPAEADIVDLYRMRSIVECGAVRDLRHPSQAQIEAVREPVRAGLRAAAEGDWRAVGTADLRFHQALTALAGSARLDELMRGMLAELRLIFHLMASPREFHEPYLARNEEIVGLIDAGENQAAARVLAGYLADAERQLTEAARALAPSI
ncbi:GntR family transcriptional regulator [Micromonospora sp. NPDC049559]|uniref:GntR family transcriptional regulator n=1 Tax=Micromonospora sp. NPDC049559 TaxID=3155923 RepID=UPI00341ACA97